MATSMRADLEMVKQRVQTKFTEIQTALHMREKLLMRQIDVIATSQLTMGRGSSGVAKITSTADEPTSSSATQESENTKEVRFLAEHEEELLAAIRGFGRFQLDNMNLQDIYLRNEDYIAPSDDHETMYKCLQDQDTDTVQLLAVAEESDAEQSGGAIVVDFSRNKTLIEHNAKHMNESIINITLAEAKELIRKAKLKRETHIPPLNLEELDDELESSIAEAVSSLGRESPAKSKSSQTPQVGGSGGSDNAGKTTAKPKKNRFQPKITINNCNGTINLRNISSLTINCATEDSVSADLPLRNEDGADGEGAEKSQEETDEADTTTSSTTPHTKCSKGAQKVTNANYKHASVTVESSSTENTTPTTTASSSNYSSNASSRSQSKKQRQNSGKKSNQNKNVTSTNSGVTTTTTTTTQPPSSSSAGAYAYEEIVHAADGDNNDVDDDDDAEANIVPCEFYNRLLNEIKNSLKEKTIRTIDNTHYLRTAAADSSTTCDVNSNASSSNSTAISTSQSQPQPAAGKRLVLKNFENLKIILEANSDEETFHPVQIEQWLAEIISETDAEPMQNTDILEHSKIHNESA